MAVPRAADFGHRLVGVAAPVDEAQAHRYSWITWKAPSFPASTHDGDSNESFQDSAAQRSAAQRFVVVVFFAMIAVCGCSFRGADEADGGNGDDDICTGEHDDLGRGGDGYGVYYSTTACVQPDATAAVDGDCNDSDASIYPGAEETTVTTMIRTSTQAARRSAETVSTMTATVNRANVGWNWSSTPIRPT